MPQVDRHTADIIRWYAQEKMTETGRHPTSTAEFGYGTLTGMAIDMVKWSRETGHTLYSLKLKSGDTVPTLAALAIRIRTYIDEAVVIRASRDDARWFASEIRKRSTKPITPLPVTTEPVVESEGEVTINKPVEEKGALPATYDNSLDSIRDLALSFRNFGDSSDDAELSAIMATTELALLRLLMERL